MATSKSRGGADIKFDEFIKHVKPDPASTEQVVLMTGYVGASDKDDLIRLYGDAGLSEYIDIPKEDILYAVPNTGDALGGSQLWVKQTAQVKYTEPGNYAQGNIYSDYMQGSYDPGYANFGGGGITQICPGPILTKPVVCQLPSKFICPTPASKLVICTIKKTIFNCPVTITKTITNQPSLVDGCPSQWGCPTQTWQTQTINQGGGGAQFSGDYTGGDMYGDYMKNTYDPGAATAALSPAPPTSPQICYVLATTTAACFATRPQVCYQYPSVFIRCITRNNFPTICRPCYQTLPTTTITPTTPQQTFPGGGINFSDAANYTGGDIYGDYMQNSYDPGTNPAAFGPGAPTSPQLCLQLATTTAACYQFTRPMQTQPPVCLVLHSVPAFRCITKNNIKSICRPCWETPITPHTLPQQTGGGINFAGTNAGDYTGGDIYGDYMQHTYDPGTGAAAFGPAAPTSPQVCLQLATNNIICQVNTSPVICYHFPSVPAYRCITRNNIRTICRPCWETPPFTQTITTTPQQTFPGGGLGGGNFGDQYNPYGY